MSQWTFLVKQENIYNDQATYLFMILLVLYADRPRPCYFKQDVTFVLILIF